MLKKMEKLQYPLIYNTGRVKGSSEQSCVVQEFGLVGFGLSTLRINNMPQHIRTKGIYIGDYLSNTIASAIIPFDTPYC